jgi:histidinol-phosphate aminotransferase
VRDLGYGSPVPRIRSDIALLSPYVPGRSIEEVAAEVGLRPEEMVKLASNECPEGPFPGVIEAAATGLVGSNRYPDNDHRRLSAAVAGWLGVSEDRLWFGSGSVGLISHIALAVGGPGTSAVYAWPSFVMYRIATRWAMTEAIEVPLDEAHRHDLDGMLEAIRDDTTVVYVCNPNNPTATVVEASEMAAFIESVPESVLIVVDEAYHDYVTGSGYATTVPHALERDNVVVLRTFSKVFALAALRVGYAVADPATIVELRKAQAPFTVTEVAQIAATASLADPAELQRRIEANAAARHHLLGAIAERSLPHTESHTNFVYLEVPLPADAAAKMLGGRGVIVRPMSGGWLRVTIGTPAENQRFLVALDEVLAGP